MGRPSKVKKDEIILLIKKYIKYFSNNSLPSTSSAVWKQMSRDLDGRWIPHSVYTHITENKNGNLTTAREMCGIFLSPPRRKNKHDHEITADDSNLSITDDESSYKCDKDFDGNTDFDEFPLILTTAEWEMIKPNDVSEKTRKRLKSRVWANIIFKAFWLRYKLPCAFKGIWSYANISEDGSFLVKFRGTCRSNKCLNVIIGSAGTPIENGILKLTIKTRDTRFMYHEDVKRPLNGEERRMIGEKLKTQRPAGLRRQLIRDCMQFGEDVPPDLQNSYIYRQVKMEAAKKGMGIQPGDKRDQFTIVRDMAADSKYDKSIFDTGANPFHVIYCSPEQIDVYKEYCRIVKKPKTCADATGKLIKKFEKCPKVITGHIFLYTVTINFEKTTIPVYQMITERQDSNFLIFWLTTWIRKFKVQPPAEAVSDQERALVLAQCMAFNGMTVKQYVDEIFLWAVNDDRKRKEKFPATTTIRLDVAHFVAAATRWNCFNDKHKFRTKRFYVRVIALMIDCQSVAEFRKVFILTCLVALTPVNDYVVKTLEFQMTAEEARKELENFISIRGPIIDQLANDSENEKSDDFHFSFDPLPEESHRQKKITVTHQWIKNLIALVKPANPGKIPEIMDNALYLPPIVDDLERVGKEFVLWTGAAVPDGMEHASSAYQEGYFNDLKHRVFEHVSLPCVCHRFLKMHLDDILSGNCLVAAKLKKFIHGVDHAPYSDFPEAKKNEQYKKHQSDGQKNQKMENFYEPNDSDFFSLMQWRGIVNEDKKAFWPHMDGNNNEHQENFSSVNIDTEQLISDVLHLESDYLPNVNDQALLNDNYEINNNHILSIKEYKDEHEPQEKFSNDTNNATEHMSDIIHLDSGNLQSLNTEELLYNISVINDNNCSLVKKIESSENSESNINCDTTKLRDPLFFSTPLKDHSYAKLETTCDRSNSLSANFPVKELDIKCGVKLGLTKKMKKRRGYFDPYPQIKILNERGCAKRTEFFLPNGIQSAVVKCNGMNIKVINTCAIDSIIHILQFAAIDDSTFFSKIKLSKNKLLKFIADFLKTGATNSVLLHRCQLLSEFYSLTSLKGANALTPYRLNAKDGVTNVWEKYSMGPSGVRRSQCSNITCRVQKSYNISYLDVNRNMIDAEGFQSLSRALKLHRSWKCSQVYCDGMVNEVTDLNDIIFIELNIKTNVTQKVGLQCKLNDIPLELNVGKGYRLIGIIDYRKIMDHFVAYCHGMTHYWLECDDMSMGSTTCSADTTVTPVAALYMS